MLTAIMCSQELQFLYFIVSLTPFPVFRFDGSHEAD